MVEIHLSLFFICYHNSNANKEYKFPFNQHTTEIKIMCHEPLYNLDNKKGLSFKLQGGRQKKEKVNPNEENGKSLGNDLCSFWSFYITKMEILSVFLFSSNQKFNYDHGNPSLFCGTCYGFQFLTTNVLEKG